MRIAYLNPTVLMRRPIAELAAVCAEHGDEVTVISPREQGKAPDERRADRLLNHPKITLLPIWSTEIKQILWSIPTDRQTVKKLRTIIQSYDVLHLWAPYYPLTLLAILLVWLIPSPKARLILTLDTIPGRSFSMGWLLDTCFWVYHRLLAGLFSRVASKITLYGTSLKPFARVAGFWSQKTIVIPSGIFLSSGRQPQKKVHPTPKLQKTLSILFVGLLNHRKGIDTLLAVAEIFQNRRPNQVVFTVVGSSNEEALWRSKVDEHGLNKTVQFVGSQKDIEQFYTKADIFFLPSRGEGLPGVVMEAMQAGLPIISSQIPCLPDLVTEGQTGYLCQMDDVAGFVARLEDLIDHPAQRRVFGENGSQQIQAFDWKLIFPRYYQIYQEKL